MAKATKPAAKAKTPAKTAKKKESTPVKAALRSSNLIVKACEASLAKFGELDIEYQLQSEINWCLGSYHNDGNPVGLYQMAERALNVFKEELARKTKGVTPKLIADLQKALNSH